MFEENKMKTRNHAEEVLKDLYVNKPFEIFESIDKNNQGMNFILSYLNDVKNHVSAGELAKALKVSTARIAILLKKLIKNNFVKKQNAPKDARISIISITDKGKKFIETEKEKIIALVEKLIKKVGIDDLKEYIKLSLKIKNATIE